MAVTPIDIQVNMGQMQEIGRGEQSRNMSITGMQKALDDEAAKEAAMKNTKVDETNKGEQEGINDSLNKEGNKEKQQNLSKDKNEYKSERKIKRAHDDRRGTKIDFFK